MALSNDKKFIVYMHTSPSGKKYVGITCQKPDHRYGKNGNGYKSMLFGRAIKKYGGDNIKHEILFEGLTREEACKKEQEMIETYKTYKPEYGYNCTMGGDYYEATEEAKKRNSESKKLYFANEENRRRASERLKAAYENNPELRRRASERRKGKKLSEETKAKMREWHANNKVEGGGARIGHEVSEETRRKLSVAHTGKKMSEEAKKKMSLSRKGNSSPFKGKKFTPEQLRKLSESHKGYKPTEETRRKLSMKTKQYWANKKAREVA